MKRLTKREYGEISCNGKEIPCSSFCNNCSQGTGNCEIVKEMVEKLAEYEDLEEQGRLLKLPCKVGDTVYRINEGAKEPVIAMRVLQVCFMQLHKDRTIMRIDAINDNDMNESCYLLEHFGEKVFFTRAEAEARLKELRGEEDGR